MLLDVEGSKITKSLIHDADRVIEEDLWGYDISTIITLLLLRKRKHKSPYAYCTGGFLFCQVCYKIKTGLISLNFDFLASDDQIFL
jgi:hypothetical protein